jgi:Recombination endonuclease VII
MERSQETATDKKERALRQRCKKYGITPAILNAIGEFQGWCCGVCGRHQSEFRISLAIDHAHFRIFATRCPTGGWQARAVFQDEIFADVTAKTKAAAIQQARQDALPKSVRGLLCPGRHGRTGQCCNRLMSRIDDWDWLEQVQSYLKNPPARKIIT